VCCGLDTIGLALDFAENRTCQIPPRDQWHEHIGLRLFSPCSGTLLNVDVSMIVGSDRVKEVYIKRDPGHEITLPPEDYDSWLLGHVIFEPRTDMPTRQQCDELKKNIIIDVERYYDQKLTGIHDASRRVAQSADSPARQARA
jgi:hypothetical protein